MSSTAWINLLFVAIFFKQSNSELAPMNRRANFHCDGTTKNSLIEHFFNVIFSEFHGTPPVCVCVQMCAGDSTYCYPNGCLKRDDLRGVEAPQSNLYPHSKNAKKLMFVVDERLDLLPDFLERRYQYDDDFKRVTSNKPPVMPYNSDIFKDKSFVKFKKSIPQVEIKYNLREQVLKKNLKSDILKTDNIDNSNSRWPMNKLQRRQGHKLKLDGDKRLPFIGKSQFFVSMLADNTVAEYPPKYFKRDVKTTYEDDVVTKDFYEFEKYDKLANFTSLTLEKLIESLIGDKTTKNTTNYQQSDLDNNMSIIPLKAKATNKSANTTQVNLVNEVINSDNNTLKAMINGLSKKIEKQNNTSMELSKKLIGDITEECDIMYTAEDDDKINNQLKRTQDNVTKMNGTGETTQASTYTESEVKVTKKIRQRTSRRLRSSKSNW